MPCMSRGRQFHDAPPRKNMSGFAGVPGSCGTRVERMDSISASSSFAGLLVLLLAMLNAERRMEPDCRDSETTLGEREGERDRDRERARLPNSTKRFERSEVGLKLSASFMLNRRWRADCACSWCCCCCCGCGCFLDGTSSEMLGRGPCSGPRLKGNLV